MPGPENYDFNNGYLWGKKDITPNNYVEITPEQQAEIDKAKAAKDNEALAKGLNGDNVKDLSKGVSVQRTEPVRTDIGNGGTKITHPDGTVEFVFDYAKGYNGAPQLFDKDTKVTYLNAPAPEVISPGVNQDKIDEWGRQVSHGQIRHLGRGLNALGNVATFAFGVGIFAKAFKGANTVVQFFNSAVKGGGTLIGAAALASCSKEEPMSPPDAGASLKVTDEMFAQWAINYLGETEHQTPDGLGYKYYFDDETKKPYAEFDNKFKHFIGDDLSFKEDGAMKTMYDMLGNLPLINKDKVTEKGIIATLITTADLANGNQGGSYDLQNPGFTMELIPCDLKEVTSGSPELKITIGEDVIQGKPEVVSAGDFKVFSNGQEKDCSSNAICIKDSDGKPMMLLQFEKNFEEYYGNKFDGVVVYVPDDAGKLTEKYLMSEITDTETMIQHINRETQPAGQWYTTTIQKFDANGIDEEYDKAYKSIKAGADADANIDY